jgi:hypothetical protein
MRRSIGAPLCLLAAMSVSGIRANAQASCAGSGSSPASCAPSGVEVTTTVQKIVALEVTPASAGLTAPTDADFASSGDVKVTDLAMHSLTVRSNVSWQITLQGATWTAPYSKAVGDLEWTKDAGSNWNTTSTSAAVLQSGAATASSAVTVGYRTRWRLNLDVPGAYSMPLTLTVSSQ